MQKKQGLESMPFGGLGFDLGPVLQCAAGLRLRRVLPPRSRPSTLIRLAPPPAVWGYGLMLVQGRETLGR